MSQVSCLVAGNVLDDASFRGERRATPKIMRRREMKSKIQSKTNKDLSLRQTASYDAQQNNKENSCVESRALSSTSFFFLSYVSKASQKRICTECVAQSSQTIIYEVFEKRNSAGKRKDMLHIDFPHVAWNSSLLPCLLYVASYLLASIKNPNSYLR